MLADFTESQRRTLACSVCGNWPNEEGELEHGRGCYTQSENGGGSEFFDVSDMAAFGHKPQPLAAAIERFPDIREPHILPETVWTMRLYRAGDLVWAFSQAAGEIWNGWLSEGSFWHEQSATTHRLAFHSRDLGAVAARATEKRYTVEVRQL